jgi:hypothetical protein
MIYFFRLPSGLFPEYFGYTFLVSCIQPTAPPHINIYNAIVVIVVEALQQDKPPLKAAYQA